MTPKNTWATGESFTAANQNDIATAVIQSEIAHNSGTNLLVDGSYERDATWWGAELATGAVELSTTQAYSGAQSLKIIGARSHRPNVTSAGKSGSDAANGVIPSMGGRVYRFTCRLYRPATNTTSGFMRVRIGAVGAGGTDLTGGVGPTSTVNQIDIPTNQWWEYINYYTVPYTGTNAPYTGVYPQLSTESVNATDVFYIDKARFEDLTNSPPQLIAPPPTGDRTTDTLVLQRLSDLAQTTRGTVVLREGTYAADIVTAKVNNQPRFVGQGKQQTKIDGTIKWQGVSSKYSGGWMSGFSLTGSHAGSAAIEFNGVCDVHWDELRIEGTYDTGLLFYNQLSGDFTELNNGKCDFYKTVTTAIEYRTASGMAASFHQSGLTGGAIQTFGTAPSILIGPNNARPYNAPLTCGIWTDDVSQAIIQHNGDTRANFYGHLTLESQDTDPNILVAAGNTIYLAGTISSYLGGGGTPNYGTCVLVKTVHASQAGGVAYTQSALIDTNSNITADNFISTRTSTATAAGTTTLTIADTQTQVFTGTTTQTVKLPTTGIVAGQVYKVINNSTGSVTVQSSGANTISSLGTLKSGLFTAKIDTPTGSSDWEFLYQGGVSAAGHTVALRDGNGIVTAASYVASPVSTVTAAGTTTLTSGSSKVQVFTGTTTQTVALPTTSIVVGWTFEIYNNSTGAVTVQSSGGNTVATVAASTMQIFKSLVTNPTTAAHWRAI